MHIGAVLCLLFHVSFINALIDSQRKAFTKQSGPEGAIPIHACRSHAQNYMQQWPQLVVRTQHLSTASPCMHFESYRLCMPL